MQKVYEKIVKRVWRISDYIRAALLITAALLISVAAVFAMPILTKYGLSLLVPIIIVGSGVGVWYLIGLMRTEFEYCCFNGEFDLDVITAKRSRRRVATVHARDFEQFGKYSDLGKSVRQMKDEYEKRYFMCSSPESDDCWYAVFVNDRQRALLVFQPSDEMIADIKATAPRLFR